MRHATTGNIYMDYVSTGAFGFDLREGAVIGWETKLMQDDEERVQPAHLRVPDWAWSAVTKLPPLAKSREVAALLGVSKNTLDRWRASGKIKAAKTHPRGSGRVLYSREEVARLLASIAAPY